MIIGVDHILIAVDDVDKASDVYRPLGFQVFPGGVHPRTGSHNALIPLSDASYLELIGLNDRRLAEQFPITKLVARALEGNNRLATFALLSDDIANDVAAIRRRGLKIGDPIDGERVRPDGQKVRWRTAHPEDPMLPFLIEDITPHHMRVPEATGGLGKVGYLGQVLLSTADLDESSKLLTDLLGDESRQDGIFAVERCTIRLARDSTNRQGISRVTIAVDDLDAVTRDLNSRGVRTALRDGRVEIDPAETLNAQLAFALAV